MARPRISEDLMERITTHADALLADSPVEADDLPFERRLEIVFDEARERSSGKETKTDGGVDRDPDAVPDGTEGDHPGGDAAAEQMFVDGL